jgi:hypothetical protein
MQIKYELVPEDLVYYSKEAAKGTTVFTVQVVMWTVIVLLFIMADLLWSLIAVFLNDGSIRVESVNIIPRAIIGIALIGISYFVLMAVSKQASRRYAATPGKNGVFCQHIIQLDEAGFTETTHVNKAFFSWDGVEEVRETKSFVILQIRVGAAYLIPKRAFSTPEEISQFVSAAQTYLESATSPHDPPPPPAFHSPPA